MKRWITLIVIMLPLSLPAQPSAPDERILWQLFQAHKLETLARVIKEWRHNYPSWQPPPQLLQEMGRLRQRQVWQRRHRRIAAAVKKQDWPGLLQLARRYPSLFSCRHPGHLETLALAYGKAGELQRSLDSYRRLLACPSVQPEDLLQRALWQLPPPVFGQLLHDARGKLNTATWKNLHYQNQRRRLLQLHHDKNQSRLLSETKEIAETIVARRDLDLIRLLGWAAYRQQDWQAAAFWFEQGLKLAPREEELAYGLSLTYRQLGDNKRLLELASRFGRESARIRHLTGDHLLLQAWQAYQNGDYSRSRHLVQHALPWLQQSDEARYLLGWIEMKTGNPQAALQYFQPLYQDHPDRADYAEAMIQAYLDSGLEPAHLRRSPVLDRIIRRRKAELYYARKRFLLARQTDPGAVPQLENIDSPGLETSALYRFKSGDKGLDRLEILMVPLFSGKYVHGSQRFGLSLGRIDLASGELNNVSRLAANATQAQQLQNDPPIHALQAAWLELSYRREGGFNPYLTLGHTPINDLITPRPTLRLGLQDHWRKLNWNVELYSQPVRLSLLSYTGWKALGKKWGRVLRSGIQTRNILNLGEHWSVYQNFDVAFLDGRRTKDNWAIQYTIAPGYNIRLAGFDYLTLGPYFDFQHYGNNQNHFRLGHGGYFSPQRFYGEGLQLNLQTQEGRRFLIEGRMALGIQHFYEATAPWFPIGCPFARCDGRYPSSRTTRFAPDLRVRMVGQVNPLVQLGGGVYARKSGDFREVGVGLFIRLLFEPRRAVFSSDLPALLFGAIE
ncbi:cellulose synthase operon protein C [Methylomarinovum caldicuralii]|uniref:Cellulose synthase operon protein C n=1 Tax=Methylomarinovum caldicuralii TaxID=438856 RepID=A0AAU9CDY1_9GAMM|nr:cellulose synthase subunit BcsC-related outer membrane protein [Methylomarinovum caldicuralii]BCX82849.1 cellulose synthase operon protein C [Methylomarinovum caldicuralii]